MLPLPGTQVGMRIAAVSVIMKTVLKCYVSGRPNAGDSGRGVVSFAVPDYGILFRSLAEGSRMDLEMIALLSFLRFAVHNQDVFGSPELHICTDYDTLAAMMEPVNPSAKPGSLQREARKIAGKLRYKVLLVASEANRAAGSVADIPDLPANTTLEIKSFAGLTIRQAYNPFSVTPIIKSQ
jgi:hypothetical protein